MSRSGFGCLGQKTTGGWFLGLGRKTRLEVSRRNTEAHGGIAEVASRRSKSVEEAWPSDRPNTQMDQNAPTRVVMLILSCRGNLVIRGVYK